VARSTFKRDSAGIAEVLKSSAFGSAVAAHASAIAASVRGRRPGADVVVDTYTTDRAAASVTIRDRRAMQWQAEDGDLTAAAAAQGLDVTDRTD
jgi:hypothetical protein